MFTPVILCGGSGNRLWPLSRETYPKQLLKLTTQLSLLQNTLLSAQKICKLKPIIIANEAYRFIIREQLAEINIEPQVIMLESIPKDTAAAIALCCFHVKKTDNEGQILALPSDNFFEQRKHLEDAIQHANLLAQSDKMITFGIRPTSANTAYGYIKCGKALAEHGFEIESFTEKPDQEKADQFIQSKQYFWNCGIFLMKAKIYLDELKKHATDIYKQCKKIYDSNQIDSLNFMHFDALLFDDCPKLSIDYAVMEKTKKAVMIPVTSKWADMGSWDSLWELKTKDDNGNIFEGDIISKNVHDSFIHTEERLIAAIGVNNLIIVETQDAILVCDKNHSKDVKEIVTQLKYQKRKEVEYSHKVYRPWGYFEILVDTDYYKVKRLMIKPSAQLSLQKHLKRSEHWVIVSGIASVIRGEEELQLLPSESAYIPAGCKHRIANFEKELLHVIEVQTGSYLGEDDIIRFDDVYHRKDNLN